MTNGKSQSLKNCPGWVSNPVLFILTTLTSYPTKNVQPRHGDSQNNDTQHVSKICSDECRNSVQHAECRFAECRGAAI